MEVHSKRAISQRQVASREIVKRCMEKSVTINMIKNWSPKRLWKVHSRIHPNLIMLLL